MLAQVSAPSGNNLKTTERMCENVIVRCSFVRCPNRRTRLWRERLVDHGEKAVGQGAGLPQCHGGCGPFPVVPSGQG
jgi:hypothetical protein